jgi:hypothetical protein
VALEAPCRRPRPPQSHPGGIEGDRNKSWVPPFKPGFGLSGITALDVPLPVLRATYETEAMSNPNQIGRVRYFFPRLNSKTVPINGMKATMKKTGAYE